MMMVVLVLLISMMRGKVGAVESEMDGHDVDDNDDGGDFDDSECQLWR